MGLQQQLDAFKAEFARKAPVSRPALYEAKTEELRASFALERAVRMIDSAIGAGCNDDIHMRLT
jgi:hypothetical protein